MTDIRTGPPTSDLLSMTTACSDAGVRVSLVGEVDSSTTPQLTDCLDRLLSASPAEVVIDLTQVTFLDSAGLHALVLAHGRAAGQGTRLRVLVATRAVERPIQVTGLWDVLGVEQVQPGAA